MPVPADRETWMKEANEEAQRQWGYAEMLTEDRDVFEAAFAKGESPKQVVKELGEELGLSDPGPWSPSR
jgi:hypothetical protein